MTVVSDVAMRRLLARLLIGFLVALDVDDVLISAQHFYYSKTAINNVVIEDGKVRAVASIPGRKCAPIGVALYTRYLQLCADGLRLINGNGL